jgi:hypothetical protein
LISGLGGFRRGPRGAYNPGLSQHPGSGPMSIDQLAAIAQAMVAPGKGIIAID